MEWLILVFGTEVLNAIKPCFFFSPLAIESLAVAVKLGDLKEVPNDARQLKLV